MSPKRLPSPSFILSLASLTSQLPGNLHIATLHASGSEFESAPSTIKLRFGGGLDGCISDTHGFLNPPADRAPLPSCLAPWEAVHDSLPSLFRRGTVPIAVDALPAQQGEWETLEQRHLSRAAVILSVLAHAFSFGYRDEEARKRLPLHLLRSWELVCQRLGRNITGRVVADDILNNANPFSSDTPFALSSNFFDLPEERLTPGLQGAIEARFAPALRLMAVAQSHVSMRDSNHDAAPDAVAVCLEHLSSLLVACAVVFQAIAPQSAASFDPVIWVKTYPTIGQPVQPGELGNSGVDAPLFQALDAFVGPRDWSKGDLSSMQTDRRASLPTNVRLFLSSLQNQEMSVRRYAAACGNKRLLAAFDGLLQTYVWFLEAHRVKAVGITGVTLATGRHTTSTGVNSRQAQGRPPIPPDAILSAQMKAGMASRLSCRPLWQIARLGDMTCGEVADLVELRFDTRLPLEAGDRVLVYHENDSCEEGEKTAFYSVGDAFRVSDGTGVMAVTLTVGHRGHARPAFLRALNSEHHQPQCLRVRPWPCPRFRTPQDPSAPLVLVGQGSGVGPLLGILRERARKLQCRNKEECDDDTVAASTKSEFGPMRLFIAARRRAHVPCRWANELEKLTFVLPSLMVVLALSQEEHICVERGESRGIGCSGRVTRSLTMERDVIRNMVTQEGGHIFVCGSTDFGECVRQCLGLEYNNNSPFRTATLNEEDEENEDERAYIPDPSPYWKQFHEDLFGPPRRFPTYMPSTPSLSTTLQVRKIPHWELSQHNTMRSCWTCVLGTVYDVTRFLTLHPGGSKTLLECSGLVADRRFLEVHSGAHWQEIIGRMGPYAIGKLDTSVPSHDDQAVDVLTQLVRVQNALTNNTAFSRCRTPVPFYVYSEALLVLAENGFDEVISALPADRARWAVMREDLCSAQKKLQPVFTRLYKQCRDMLAGASDEADLKRIESAVMALYRRQISDAHRYIDSHKKGLRNEFR